MEGSVPTSGSNDPLMGQNHLTAIRWVLAGFVALGHLWLLTKANEPFRIHDWTGGYMAVNGFFVLSGLLIAKSLFTRRNLKSYALSRLLRIYPAFIVVTLSFAFIFAPFFSQPGGIERVFSSETWQYVLKVFLLDDPHNAPGGIFKGNIEADFNGPLWTIRFEIAAYVLAAIVFALKIARGLKSTLALFLIVQITYLVLPLISDFSVLPESVKPFLRLASAFLMGMVLWHWPAARRPSWWIVAGLFAAFLLLGNTFIGELLANLALTGVILRFGLPLKPIKPLLRLPDYSYGIYVWHYPAMQAVLYVQPDLGPYRLMLFSVPLFLCLSALSWNLVEKPALRLKPKPKLDPRSEKPVHWNSRHNPER